MLTASLITVLSSLLLVNAQTNPQLETEASISHFDQSLVGPTVFPGFEPSGFLTVSFGGNPIAPGTPLTIDGKRDLVLASTHTVTMCTNTKF
jgi:hypothetical protein